MIICQTTTGGRFNAVALMRKAMNSMLLLFSSIIQSVESDFPELMEQYSAEIEADKALAQEDLLQYSFFGSYFNDFMLLKLEMETGNRSELLDRIFGFPDEMVDSEDAAVVNCWRSTEPLRSFCVQGLSCI